LCLCMKAEQESAKVVLGEWEHGGGGWIKIQCKHMCQCHNEIFIYN
jgi:hypothetical protein